MDLVVFIEIYSIITPQQITGLKVFKKTNTLEIIFLIY